jgi:hypothetical protein
VVVVVDRVRADESLPARMRQRVDGAVQAFLRELLRLTRPRAEAGTPEQPFGLGGPETASMDWDLACSRQRRYPLSVSALRLDSLSPYSGESSANSGRTNSSNVFLSQLATVVGTSAVTDAVRGISIASATSPK